MFWLNCFIFILLVLNVLISGEKVCPAYGNVGYKDDKLCFDQCSPDDDQCGSNKKCCFFLTYPCGYRCIIPKDNQAKQGECPLSNSNHINLLWSMRDIHLCDVDNDCPDNEKCCSNMCNSKICVTPRSTRKKRSFIFYR